MDRDDKSRRLIEEVARACHQPPWLYRLGLNGKVPSDEMTRFVYVLKEVRACLEAEILIDVQQRLAMLTRDMENHNGHRVLYQPTLSRD
jgi:hypothetical protein